MDSVGVGIVVEVGVIEKDSIARVRAGIVNDKVGVVEEDSAARI
jgi:hypothetical protein